MVNHTMLVSNCVSFLLYYSASHQQSLEGLGVIEEQAVIVHALTVGS